MLAHALISGLWEDCHELEASMGSAVSSKQAWAVVSDLISKINRDKTKGTKPDRRLSSCLARRLQLRGAVVSSTSTGDWLSVQPSACSETANTFHSGTNGKPLIPLFIFQATFAHYICISQSLTLSTQRNKSNLCKWTICLAGNIKERPRRFA